MLKQQLQFKLSQKLSPQQIQLMKLIQLPTQEFEERLQQEIEENPALENGKEAETTEKETEDYDDVSDNEVINTEDINIDDYLSDDEIPQYRLQANNYSRDDEEKQIPYAGGISFHQYLASQLDTFSFSDHHKEIASFLLGSIDDIGYIRRDMLDIVDDLAFIQNITTDEKEVVSILKKIHHLDPAGVGARDLQECLLIQLKRKEISVPIKLAIQILELEFDAFSKKHFDKLQLKLDVEEALLKEAILEIEKLNPKPGASFSGNSRINSHVVPDFTIQIVEGELVLTLNGRNAPELHVSPDYNNMLLSYKNTKEKSKSQAEAVLFIKQKLDAAKWFIDAIKQRNHTLMITMNAIMKYQEEYFLTGDDRLIRPMILKDIADIIEMDISTISRVANSKYVDTPYGTKLIKSFFSERMTTEEGIDVSTIQIKDSLTRILEEEDKKKPFTDEQLTVLLKKQGYPIARRTVAKYRELLGFSVARLRKEI